MLKLAREDFLPSEEQQQQTSPWLATSSTNHQFLLSQCKYLKLKEDRITIYSDQTLSHVVDRCVVRKRLGRGAGGSVFMCEQLPNEEEQKNGMTLHQCNKMVALKSIQVEDVSSLENAVGEYSLLVKMNQNGRGNDFRITPVYDIFIDIQQEFNVYVMYFSMPVYKNDLEKFVKSPAYRKAQYDHRELPSLDSSLEASSHQTLPTKFQVALSVATNIAKALSYIHKNNIVHRDIKLANILIEDIHSDGLSVVLADFGLSKEIENSSRHSKVGTLSYLSPEVLSGQEYGFRVDCFALGVVLYQILTGDFTKRIAWDLLQHPEQKVRDDLKSKMIMSLSNTEVDFIDLVLEMLVKDPHRRIHSTAIYHFCLMKKTKSRKMQQVSIFEKNSVQPIPPPRDRLSEAQQKLLKAMRQQSSQTEESLKQVHPESEEILSRHQSFVEGCSSKAENSDMKSKEIRRSKSFHLALRRTELTIHVYPNTFASSFKRLFSKSEEKQFNSIEAALIYAKKQPSSVFVTIYLHPGVHKHRHSNLNIERGNLIIEGVEESDEEAVVQAERITILQNVEIRKMNFVGRKLAKGSLLTKPITIEIDQCQPTITNCKIKGRIQANGRSNRMVPILEENEIYGNSQTVSNDVAASALYFEGCCPHLIGNKIHDNETNGIVLLNCYGATISENHLYNNWSSNYSWALKMINCENVSVQGNTFFDNGACILLSNSTGSVQGNEFKNCKKGVMMKDSKIEFHENEMISMKELGVVAKKSSLQLCMNKFFNSSKGIILEDMEGAIKIIGNAITGTSAFLASISAQLSSNTSALIVQDNIFSRNLGGGIHIIRKDVVETENTNDVHITNNRFFKNSVCCIKALHTQQLHIKKNSFSGSMEHSIILDQCAGEVVDNVFSDHLFASALKITVPALLVLSICDNKFSHNACFDIALIVEAMSCNEKIEVKSNHFSGSAEKSIIFNNQDLQKNVLLQLQQENTFNEEN
ncbi:hypothetical protein FDP41_012159 [Naegleria fowleri]|uniref:Protein kinase domain-containing protein n=1 Tax=Naegleria fowleri TaxID=5763 RepID=A0A6A5C422_NAEFO|nr:uncharacterized protein FDP41_012159 [Naegleria fowleri]KAF0981502.1 hypothetical protein FDP41_012159 [Naegleria fowleri]